MLEKILVILVGLFMSLVGAIAPTGMFAAHPTPGAGLSLGASSADEVLATVSSADGTAFAKLSVLWVEVEGHRVTDDAWGTGLVNELRFKVGTKNVDGLALDVGDKVIALHPTDVLSVRTFNGEFAYRGMGTPAATLQLQGSVKTTLVSQGASTGRVVTQPTGAPRVPQNAPPDGKVSYVVLDTGERVDTVDVQSGGQRLFTQDASLPAAVPQTGNLVAGYVKINGVMVKAYTSGDGPLDAIEFQPAPNQPAAGLVAYHGDPAKLDPASRVLVKDFVGEYLAYPTADGLVRLRLDGYAASFASGTPASLDLGSSDASGSPHVAMSFEPLSPRTADTVTFHDESTDDGYIVVRQWSFGDGVTSVSQAATHRYLLPGVYQVTLNVTDSDLRQREITMPVTVRNTDPLVGFDYAPKLLDTQTLVAFTDKSQDIDSQIVNWTWDFGDGGHAYTQNPSHQFTKAGNLTVTLSAADSFGGRASLSANVFVRDLPPVANFHANPNAPLTLVPVQFIDDSVSRDSTLVGWRWDFGDGAVGTGSAPTHVYLHPGTYTVALTATDAMGAADTITQQLPVLNRPPVPDFDWNPKGGNLTVPVTFTSTSTDPDSPKLITQWDFGDNSSSSLGDSVTHSFQRRGTYPVTIHVTDGLAESSLTRDVTIADAAPIATFLISPNPTYRSLPVGFRDTSTDPDQEPIASRVWNFGNGNTSTLASASQVYTQLGSFPISLTVSDAEGKSSTVSTTLQVLPRIPVGAIQYSPSMPIARQPVTFTGVGKDLDDPSGNAPLSYQWAFGDDDSKSTLQSFSHTFKSPGTYSVSLVVTDADGVSSPPIVARVTVGLATPVPAFAWSPSLPNQNAPVQFTDQSTTANAGNITQWSWDFGDGTASQAQNPIHAYSAGGTYSVTLNIVDAQGARNSTSTHVRINWIPHAAFVGPTGSVPTGTAVSFTDQSYDADNESLTRAWNFGDGNVSTDLNPTHTYAIPGTHVVTLQVTDPHGASDTMSHNVLVIDRPPVAGFHFTPASPVAGQGVAFNPFPESYDPDGDWTLTGFAWSFGDGGTSQDKVPTHVYANSGFYRPSLIVNDGILSSSPAGNLIRVGASHPVTIHLSAVLPGPRAAPLADSHFHLSLSIQEGTGNPVTFVKGDPRFLSNGNAMDLTFDAGEWMANDYVTGTISDDRYPGAITQAVRLSDLDGLTGPVSLAFQLHMPLVTTLTAQPGDGYINVSGAGIPGLPNKTADGNGDPAYRTMLERFHGTGTVATLDGVPSPGASVLVEARYLPLQMVAGVRDGNVGGQLDIPANSVLGWCTATQVTTDPSGNYAWSFSGSNCLAGSLGVFPAGVWQVRATATYSFATAGTSAPETIVVDPTGGLLWALGGAPP